MHNETILIIEESTSELTLSIWIQVVSLEDKNKSQVKVDLPQ